MRKRVLTKFFNTGEFVVRCPECPVDPLVQTLKGRRYSVCIFGKTKKVGDKQEIEIKNRCEFYQGNSLLREGSRSTLECDHC